MRKLQFLPIVFGLSVIFTMGCTKDVPLKEATKPTNSDVNLYTEMKDLDLVVPESEASLIRQGAKEHPSYLISKELYLYVPSTGDSTYGESPAMSYFLGGEKVVRLLMYENSIEVVEVNRDPRIASNLINATPVLSIPVDHLDYKCSEDNFGKCTNTEVANDDIHWSNKRYMDIKFADTALKERSTLPVQLDNFFYPCHNEVDNKVVSRTFKKDVIRIVEEKTYQSAADCTNIRSLDDITNSVFKVQNAFNLVKLNTLTSPGYQPISYPDKDEDTFGFFTTAFDVLGVDMTNQLADKVTYMNRWNPERKVVNYYLSPTFFSPGNEDLITATQISVNAVNGALKKAEAGFQINLVTKNVGKLPEDMSASMIISVEDPQSAGPIGYGPVVTNPLTGEILSGRVAMYTGNIRKSIQTDYDLYVNFKRAQLEKSSEVESEELDQPALPNLGINLSGGSRHDKIMSQNMAMIQPVADSIKSKLVRGSLDVNSVRQRLHSRAKLSPADQFQEYFDVADGKKHYDPIAVLTAMNATPSDLSDIQQAIEKGLQELGLEGELRPWSQLSELEKSRIIGKVLPIVWVPTLVHELGHNMGLRHNFKGSGDKANYYTKAELAEMGITNREIPYSSIMDYAPSVINELPMMGKYDVASLRYAYARKVESVKVSCVSKDASGNAITRASDENGECQQTEEEVYSEPKLVPINGTLENTKFAAGHNLHPIGYCTDEHVGINPDCQRFDEGSDWSSMVAKQAQSYKDYYKYRNLRNGRRSFSSLDNLDYARARFNNFLNLRYFFERYKNLGELASAETLNSIPSLNFSNLKKAATDLKDFYVGILLSPDLTCHVVGTVSSGNIDQWVPLAQISSRVTSCYGLALNGNLKVVGEIGKSINDIRSPVLADADEIDVRGVWIDKLLATRFLFGQRFNNIVTDQKPSGLLQNEDFTNEVLGAVVALVLDDVSSVQDVRLPDGSVKKEVVEYSLEDSQTIARRLSGNIDRALGLKSGPTNLNVEILRAIKSAVNDNSNDAVNDRIQDIFKVEMDKSTIDARRYKKLNLNRKDFYVGSGNALAQVVKKQVEDKRILDAVERKRLIDITLEVLQEETIAETGKPDPELPTIPLELTDKEKVVKALGSAELISFLQGKFKSEDYYYNILITLAQ